MKASLVAAIVLVISVQMTLAQYRFGFAGCVRTGSSCNAYNRCAPGSYCDNPYGAGSCCRSGLGWGSGYGWNYGGWWHGNTGSNSGTGSNGPQTGGPLTVCRTTGNSCNDYTPCAAGSYCSVSYGSGQCCSLY